MRAAYCREALYAWMASLAARSDAAAAETPPWTRDQCENMRSLGYLGADVKCPEE